MQSTAGEVLSKAGMQPNKAMDTKDAAISVCLHNVSRNWALIFQRYCCCAWLVYVKDSFFNLNLKSWGKVNELTHTGCNNWNTFVLVFFENSNCLDLLN